jgi:hypothetical protein
MTTTPVSDRPAPNVFDIISWVETKHNSMAVRFEPSTYNKLSATRTDSQKAIIANIVKYCACSWGTALMIYSSSWGETQIMGFNLYGPDINYTDSVIKFCVDLPMQQTAFNKLVASMKLADITVAQLAVSKVARARFAVTYNGSSDYSANIVEALKAYNLSVVE